MSAVDFTIATTAGNWHFDGHPEQMTPSERTAYEAFLAIAAPQETRTLSTAKPQVKAAS